MLDHSRPLCDRHLDMATAMSFPDGRHFFIEEGALKLTVARTPLQGGGEAVLESVVRFCPFCGRPVQLRI